MVQRGAMTGTEAELRLKGTVSSDKNEILFSQYGINYNNEPEIWKKGSVIYRDFRVEAALPVASSTSSSAVAAGAADAGDEVSTGPPPASTTTVKSSAGESKPKPLSKTQAEKERKRRQKARVVVEHVDIIKDAFWDARPWILASSSASLSSNRGGRTGGVAE